MKTPTEAQLKDPKWWDENAPFGCEKIGVAYIDGKVWSYEFMMPGVTAVSSPCNADVRFFSRPTKPEPTRDERLAQHIAERDAFLAEDAGPQSEQEPVADRIMELGNQVHNLACEVQNDEALADELEDVRGRLWDLGGKVRKARKREEMVRSAAHVIEMKNGSPITLYLKYCEDLYDAGMLRKAVRE